MTTLFEQNWRLLISMGVRLSKPNSQEFVSQHGLSFSDSIGFDSEAERIRCVEVAVANTEAVFDSKSVALKPRTYSSPLDFHGIKECVGHETHRDPDCHLNLLVQELRRLSGFESSPVQRSPGHAAIALLGVISPGALKQLIDVERPQLICCLFQSDSDWRSWLCSEELQSFHKLLGQRRIVFRALPSRSIKADLFSLLREELFGFVGSALLVANAADPGLEMILRTFNLSFLNGVRAKSGGPCVDEFMMMLHTKFNLARDDVRLLSLPEQPISTPVIVCGSGPSLDSSLDELCRLEKNCILVSAGSSLATLLRAGIRPHFHVHVERGYSGQLKRIYQELLDECGLEDFGEIIAILPSSIDPDLPSLYKRCVMYGRSAQTPVRAWPSLKSAVLRHEGPECLSAAFAFAMHLKPKQVYLFGCDLGAVAGFPDRSVGALGDSSRDFSLKVAGNFSAFAMSSPQMLLQLSYMRVACSACSSNPEVYNLSNGIRLPFARSLGSIEHVLAGPPGKFSIDNIFASICLSNIRSSRVLFGDTEIADAQKWISQWIDLAEKATNKPNVAVRLEASHLLSSSRNWHSPLPYSLFRGSLRDGFWLTSFAVDHYCRNANDIEYCWSSFSRFLKTLLLELDAMSSWLEVAD